MTNCPCIMTVKEMKENLNSYSDNDKIFILALHYDKYSIVVLNVCNIDTKGMVNRAEEILYDFGS